MLPAHTALLKNIVDNSDGYVLTQKEKRYLRYLLAAHFPIKVISQNNITTAYWQGEATQSKNE